MIEITDKKKQSIIKTLKALKGGTCDHSTEADLLKLKLAPLGLRVSADVYLAGAILLFEHGIDKGLAVLENYRNEFDFVFDFGFDGCSKDLVDKVVALSKSRKIGTLKLKEDIDGIYKPTCDIDNSFEAPEIENVALKNILLSLVISQEG